MCSCVSASARSMKWLKTNLWVPMMDLMFHSVYGHQDTDWFCDVPRSSSRGAIQVPQSQSLTSRFSITVIIVIIINQHHQFIIITVIIIIIINQHHQFIIITVSIEISLTAECQSCLTLTLSHTHNTGCIKLLSKKVFATATCPFCCSKQPTCTFLLSNLMQPVWMCEWLTT